MKLSAQRALLSLISNKLNYYGNIKPTALTLQQYFEFGKITREESFKFVRRELLVRFAGLTQECSRSDEIRLFDTPSARRFTDINRESFQNLLEFEFSQTVTAQMGRFNNQLRLIAKRYRNVVEMISKAIGELQQIDGISGNLATNDVNLHAAVDRLLLSHLAIRTLQNQYLSTFELTGRPNPRFSGIVDYSCDVVQLVREAYNTARELCYDYYQQSPELRIRDANQSVFVTTEPSYLYHIVFEIIKNAMRATIERNNDPNAKLPPIDIELQVNADDLLVKVCDQGGGIPENTANNLFNYTYTTFSPSDAYITPFAGFGTGLPVSRIYARYFSGDLRLSSTEGSGTEACISIKADPRKAVESFPNAPAMVKEPQWEVASRQQSTTIYSAR